MNYLKVSDYEELAKEIGVTFWCTDNLPELWEQDNLKPHLLLSGYTDYSIRFQDKFHPNKDLQKYYARIPWEEIAQVKDKYASLPAACNIKKCRNSDKYSVKIDAFTTHTFTDTPKELLYWFCVNVDVPLLPRMEMIPFGMFDKDERIETIKQFENRPKKKLLYVNFQNYTLERIYLKEHYLELVKGNEGWLTVRADADLSREQYYEEMSEHYFTLCPFGNGLDCYRTYEALALGSMPIIPMSYFGDNLLRIGLPIAQVSDMCGVTAQMLEEKTGTLQKFTENYGNWRTLLGYDYWRERIINKQKELGL